MNKAKDSYELSLDYIHELYQWKNALKPPNVKYDVFVNLNAILENTKTKIEYVLGKMPVKKVCQYRWLEQKESFVEFNEVEEKELKKLRENFKIRIYAKLLELMESISSSSPTSFDYNPLIPGLCPFEDLMDQIPKIRLDPLKMIFLVWHKALVVNEYSKIEDLKKKFAEFKKKTKGTEKEYLFNSLSETTNFHSLRTKSLYPKGKKRENDLYSDFADFIYRKCFVG